MSQQTDATLFQDQVKKGERFTFGDNWREFLGALNEKRITEAELSLKTMLDVENLSGKTFIDVGSGSGLFSLAARRLGALVYSFDYDPSSVWCTTELRRRYFSEDDNWSVAQGSALDQAYIDRLGQFDIVYSWGVLHHTGDMWKALQGVIALVKSGGGKLFISIYNDQGRLSDFWRLIKKAYCRLHPSLKPLILYPVALGLWGPRLVSDCLRLRPFYTWRNYYRERGMSPWRDIVDRVGGYPFEVAKPEEITEFYGQRGFTLCKMKTTTGGGTNEFVFELSGDR